MMLNWGVVGPLTDRDFLGNICSVGLPNHLFCALDSLVSELVINRALALSWKGKPPLR